MDNRYRTYGRLRNNKLPCRMGMGVGVSDFITFGKVDNSRNGPYKYPIDNYKTLMDFHFKIEGVYFKNGHLSYLHDVGNKTKHNILMEQFLNETGEYEGSSGLSNIKALAASWVKHHPNEEPVFEIANEPNLFPYMSPALYAVYYIKWWDYIKSAFPNAKIMNGGLFVLDKLPDAIKSNMKFLGITYHGAAEYYKTFIEVLKSVDEKYVPDYLNLHFYPYIHTNGDYKVENHVLHLSYIMKELKGLYKEDVWLTEFGNINPLDSISTYTLISTMVYKLELTNIKRWYFFHVRGMDSNLKLVKEVGGKYYKKILIAWYITLCFLKIPMLSPVRYVTDTILKFFKLPPIKDISFIIKLVKDYVDNSPQQILEDYLGELTEVGKLYLSKAGVSLDS